MCKIEWFWSGGITDTQVTIKVKLIDPTESIRLIYSKNSSFIEYQTNFPVKINFLKTVDFIIDNLEEDTVYFYTFIIDDITCEEVGSFQTIKINKPYNFAIACSSCASGTILHNVKSWLLGQRHNYLVSNSKVFDVIRDSSEERRLSLFIHMGDLHYRNINVQNLEQIEQYQRAYNDVLNQPRQRRLYQNLPIAYVWDDHDYNSNNSDSTYRGKNIAKKAYTSLVPHYPLVDDRDREGIYHSLAIGRVLFIMTDTRFYRTPIKGTSPQTRTMLGSNQKKWLLQQLLLGQQKYGLIVWVNSVPWIAKVDKDAWNQYPQEREEIVNFINNQQINNLMMISGDAHMLAFDDGTNNQKICGASFPVIHAASLDSPPTKKGAKYSAGTIPGNQQWGQLTFEDNGQKILVKVELKKLAKTLIETRLEFA
jgi:phosphodiesterase/alkaline phosphatase D-like protein